MAVDCTDCGACCREMNRPPGYWPGMTAALWPADTGDHDRLEALPAEARQAIVDRIAVGTWEGKGCLAWRRKFGVLPQASTKIDLTYAKSMLG